MYILHYQKCMLGRMFFLRQVGHGIKKSLKNTAVLQAVFFEHFSILSQIFWESSTIELKTLGSISSWHLQ